MESKMDTLWVVEERAAKSRDWQYLGTFPNEAAVDIYLARVRKEWQRRIVFRKVKFNREKA